MKVAQRGRDQAWVFRGLDDFSWKNVTPGGGKASSVDESLVEERTEMKKWAKLLAHLAGKRMEDALIR